MQQDQIISKFLSFFGQSNYPTNLYFAPGRVNLIGEHTDYNNGFVFPCALSFGTYLAIRETPGKAMEFHSDGFSFSASVEAGGRYTRHGGEWINYPLGVMEMFAQKGLYTRGLQLYYYGNIPPAAGLSSSASIEMATAFALNSIYGWEFSVLDLIHLCKKAENEFNGVSCGIMDQFAVGQGAKDHAIFLNCKTLDFKLVPVHLPGYRLVITNTNKKRGLGDSKYNERVEECGKAVEYLSKELKIKSLGDVSTEQFNQHQNLITDPVVLKRARHIVFEDQRVLDAVSALENKDFEHFGKLMVQSHDSLRDDYEVTGFELDSLVGISLKQDGVLGARMTGAGFGGCTVAFVKEENLEAFRENVTREYFAMTGLQAVFYLPEIGDGVRLVNNE